MATTKLKNLHYIRGFTTERVTSGETYLRGLAPVQHRGGGEPLASL